MAGTPILVLCDDLWHPAEVIEKGLAAMEQDKYRFDVVKTAKDILTPARLAEYPAVMCCKSNCVNLGNSAPWFEEGVTEVMAPEFERYIREGHGFFAVHSGLAYGKDGYQAYKDMVGMVFNGHPPRCAVDVKVTRPEHPVSEGVRNFVIRDEHYRIDVTCPDAEVFLESVSEKGGVQPAAYTRVMGEGRLCALTPGHTLDVWLNPDFQRLLMNGLSWCLKERR